MNKNKNYKTRQISFKRSHLVLLLCVGLMAILAVTMINNQFASAGNSLQMFNNKTPEFPVEPGNYTQSVRCDYPTCHDQSPKPWIEVSLIENESSYQTYTVNGQTDLWDWIEGWAVLDQNENNLERGFGPGEFKIQKGDIEETYRVYWVDSNSSLLGRGGSNYTDIIVPVSTNTPPSNPEITGPNEGYTGKSLNYKFVSEDNEGDDIYYKIDWGDGIVDDWDGPHPSGENQTYSHIWSNPGIYNITAKAMDTQYLESENNTFEVNITISPSEPELKIRLKMIGIGKIRVTFQNKGKEDLSDIQYNVTASGGLFRIFKRVNVNQGGTIENLTVGEKIEKKISDPSLKFRFCIAKVTVTAIVDGEKLLPHTQYVIIIGRFVFARPILLFQP